MSGAGPAWPASNVLPWGGRRLRTIVSQLQPAPARSVNAEERQLIAAVQEAERVFYGFPKQERAMQYAAACNEALQRSAEAPGSAEQPCDSGCAGRLPAVQVSLI